MQKWMLIGLMTMATAGYAQQVDLKPLDKFAALATKGFTQITLDESMLKSASGRLSDKKGDEAAAKKSAAAFKGLYLRVFQFDKKGVYKSADLKPVRDQIKGPDWTILLQSREANQETEIWIHKTKGDTDGIFLLA